MSNPNLRLLPFRVALSATQQLLSVFVFQAYQVWAETGNIQPLKSLVAKGVEHWQILAKKMLTHHQSNNELNLKKLEDLVQSNPL